MNNNKNLKQALKHFQKENYLEALEIFQYWAEQNDPKALAHLGVMYQLGLGVERNGVMAVDYLKRALELGEGSAAHNLGTIYFSGMPDVPGNIQLSKQYYRKAKEMGSQFADDNFYKD